MILSNYEHNALITKHRQACVIQNNFLFFFFTNHTTQTQLTGTQSHVT